MTATAKLLAGVLAALGLALAGCGLLKAPAAGGGSSSSPAAPLATPSSSVPYNVSGLLDPSSGKFLGIEANGAPGSLAAVSTFAANTGRKPNLVGQYVAWGRPFDATAASNAWSYGALDYMAWEPFGTSVQAIAAGRSDAYISRFASGRARAERAGRAQLRPRDER